MKQRILFMNAENKLVISSTSERRAKGHRERVIQEGLQNYGNEPE